MSNRDRFGWDDVVDGQRGIFGGSEASVTGRGAMDDWVTAKTQPTPAGLAVNFMCEQCGTGHSLLAEYPELVAIKYGLQPHVAFQGQNVVRQPSLWGFDQPNNAWFPDVKCPCGMPLRTYISIAEAGKALEVAVNSGFAPAKYIQDLSLFCARMMPRGG